MLGFAVPIASLTISGTTISATIAPTASAHCTMTIGTTGMGPAIRRPANATPNTTPAMITSCTSRAITSHATIAGYCRGGMSLSSTSPPIAAVRRPEPDEDHAHVVHRPEPRTANRLCGGGAGGHAITSISRSHFV